MKTLILGAGPAGLYLAYLLRRHALATRIDVVEQNAADATFGFGVVFSDRALEFLRDDDPDTYALVTPAMEQWSDLALFHQGRKIVIDGIGFAAIGRLELLKMMQQRLRSVGVAPRFGHAVRSRDELRGYDLVVGADGANSFVRQGQEAAFGTRVQPLANRFVWYGTPHRFDTLSQTFVANEHGHFNAHHYRYSPTMSATARPPEGGARSLGEVAAQRPEGRPVSTFIVECDPATWQRAGFDRMDEAATQAYCEQVFRDTLGGAGLVRNKSVWRRFPKVRNERFFSGRTVLVGDALRTAHFSIGSGTRLALEDVIALARALREHRDSVPDALAAYEAARKPIVDKLVTAAEASADWYEQFPQHMQLAPWDLAWSYIQRSGRVDVERLRRVSPKFVAGYEAHRAQQRAG